VSNIANLKHIFTLLSGDKPLVGASLLRKFMLLAQAVFGLLWLEGASWKVLIDGKLALNYDGLGYWVSRGSEYPVFGPYKWLIDTAIMPNIKLFLPVVFITELVIGLMYVSGKYVRLASVLAVAQTSAITLSVLKAPHEWKWSYFMMFLIAVMFFVTPTISKWSLTSRASK
jgi:thiosulfate dehydrogenase (quinone) large subunit